MAFIYDGWHGSIVYKKKGLASVASNVQRTINQRKIMYIDREKKRSVWDYLLMCDTRIYGVFCDPSHPHIGEKVSLFNCLDLGLQKKAMGRIFHGCQGRHFTFMGNGAHHHSNTKSSVDVAAAGGDGCSHLFYCVFLLHMV